MIRIGGYFINIFQKTIIVFGLPGAGKTTFIKDFIEARKGFTRLSGGSLISKDLSEQDRDYLRKQNEDQILSNQEKLVLNFLSKKNELSDRHIIFDGHCLVKDIDKLVKVPVEIIKRLKPDIILFIDEDLETIINRRSKDSIRPDRERETITQLNANRNLQIEICKNYSTETGVPFKIIKSPTIEEFELLLQKSISPFILDNSTPKVVK